MERRWMSLEDVFEQLEAAETEHALQAWEREERAETDPEPVTAGGTRAGTGRGAD